MTALCHRSQSVFLTAAFIFSLSPPLLAQTPVHSQPYRQHWSLLQQQQRLQQQLELREFDGRIWG